MFKFLIVFFLLIIGLIHFGNYFDYQKGRLTNNEYNRRTRLLFVLIFIFIGILIWVRKR